MIDSLIFRAPLLLIVLLPGLALPGIAEEVSAEIPVALIEKIAGSVTLHRPGQKAEKLDRRRDASRLLYPGEVITCGAGGEVTIRIDQSLVAPGNTTSCSAGSTITIPSLSANARRGKSAYTVLKDYSRAGRDKGPESAIYYPADKSAIMLDNFAVRWRVRPPLPLVTAILRDATGTELARVTGIDGALGTLISPVIHEALTKYRASLRPDYNAVLVLHPESGLEQAVSFSILSAKQETDLAKDLAALRSDGGIFSHVERAGVFDSFHMYNSVAAEYDAALNAAPDSLSLLRASLNVHSKIGDLQRARELRDRIQELDPDTN